MTNPSVMSLAAAALSAAPRCGPTRVVLIDGPAGSGKTTLAARLGTLINAQVLHGDDMYEGWSGLSTLHEILVECVLGPLSRGENAGFQRWDWEACARAERIEVPPADDLLIEGVGVAQRAARHYASVVLYVDAPWDVRLSRGIARDGEAMRAEWEAWHVDEDEFLMREGTRAAANVVLDGSAEIRDLR